MTQPPPTLDSRPPHVLVEPGRHVDAGRQLTPAQVENLLRQPYGESALLVLVRDGGVDVDTAVKALERLQENTCARAKRFLLAVVDALV